MAVHPHTTGKFRAYKKINGVEHQYYYKSKPEADKKQAQLDALSALSSLSVFSKTGHLMGCRLRLIKRKGRTTNIQMKIVRQVNFKRESAEVRYHGQFNEFWEKSLSKWRSIYSVSKEDYRDFIPDVKAAKRIYISELCRLEQQL